MPEIHPLAKQMAQLLTGSDLDELREVIKRWVETAHSERQRQHYHELGGRLLELKAALKEGGVEPRREELELAITMMLALAKDADQETRARRGPEK